MKHKTLLKAVKIGLCALIILTACIIPVFAVHTGGNTLYTAPLRFDIQIDGIVADLTPTLLYTSGTQYSIVNDEIATLTNGSEVSVHRGALDITSVSIYNSAIECAYKLSFDTLNSDNEFTVKITAPQGFYNFQKYTIPKIAVPNGYTATVHTEYELYKTILVDNDDVVYREVKKNNTYSGNDIIPLLYNYVTVNGVDETLAGSVFVWNYETTITFTPSGDVSVGNAGWYKWDPGGSEPDISIQEGHTDDFVMYECSTNSVYMAYVKSDFTLGYVPLDRVGFYFGESIGDYSIAYDTNLFNVENPWVIYSYYDYAWYIPDTENLGVEHDGVTIGVTPITIQYLDFRVSPESAIKADNNYFSWFYEHTIYLPDNPIVTGYNSLVGSQWYLKDSVSYFAVENFYNKYMQEYADGTPQGDAGFFEGVTIPLSYTDDYDKFYDTIFMEFQPFVKDVNDGTYYSYTFYGDFSADYIFCDGVNYTGDGYFHVSKDFSYLLLQDPPSPLAYEWLITFCELESIPDGGYPSVYSFTDGDTSLEVVYCLDSEAVIQAQFSSALSDYYNGAYRRGVANGDGEFSGDYGSWLSTAVGGFMSFEIFPNFSIGGILGVCVAVGLLMMFLKFFAGG